VGIAMRIMRDRSTEHSVQEGKQAKIVDEKAFWLEIRRAILMCKKSLPPAFKPALLMVVAAIEKRYPERSSPKPLDRMV